MSIDKYLARTIEVGTCLEWQGALNSDGYPRAVIGKNTNIKLHRYVYTQLHPEEDITGKVIRHTCDNPVCLNPNHLLSGTPADNMRDRDSRGRHGLAKTNAEEVKEIRRLYALGNIQQRELAKRFGLNHRTIFYIVHNKTWAWVK